MNSVIILRIHGLWRHVPVSYLYRMWLYFGLGLVFKQRFNTFFFWQMLLFTVIFIVTSFGCMAITGGLCYTVKYSKVVPSCLITLRSVVNKTEEQAQEELPSCELFKENDHDRVFPRGPLYRQVV